MAFCRASAAPAESPCFSRAWAISSQSPACKAVPAIGVAQATARDLLGLGRIALGQAHLGQAIEHLRLARSDALGSLEAGGGAVQVAAALLLLGGCEHRQDRPVQLLVVPPGCRAEPEAGMPVGAERLAPLGGML